VDLHTVQKVQITTTRGAFSRSFIYLTITDDIRDDIADLADPDALEYASSRASTPNQLTDDETDDETPAHVTPQPDPSDVSGQPDMVDSASASAVVVEPFSFGRPGAPIPGRPQGDPQAASVGSQWAPFQSQLDWDVARWVKLRGGSSTAVSELLAIPGVRASNFLYCVSNSVVIGR
jgi:hypothetical protein